VWVEKAINPQPNTAKEIPMRKHHARLNVERLEARELLTGYTPQQIRHAYGFDQMWLDGAGQTIAIVDAYDNPYIASDLKTFDRTFGIPDPPSFTKVNQTGGKTLPKADAGWAGEIALDVEWAHAIAPRANILLVEANSASLVDLYTAVDYARRQPGVVTVSMSFGASEGDYGPWVDANILTTPAGHIGGNGLPGGITFVASSGDNGAPGLYPAYSPNVLAVGGTSLYLDDQGNYWGEAGWSGSGGGISQYEAEPDYQYNVHNIGARTIPDVSYNADPSTGFYIYNTFEGGWQAIGGTSAGAPQWAALMALVDQARAVYLGAGSLDGATQTLPALYDPWMSFDFFDVTVGSNGYSALEGYDLVTGLGSPWAPWVVYDLSLVGYESHAPGGGAAKGSVFNIGSDDAATFLLTNHVQGATGDKSTVDAIFAESSIPDVTTPTLDMAPMQVVSTDHPTQGSVSDAGTTHVRHPQLGRSLVLGLNFVNSGTETGTSDRSL
jgi:subtilase family serine protease